MKTPTDQPLTELEGVVMALIDRAGSATAYEVKQQIAASPSQYWSGSAGAIYPAVKRLTGRRLLQPKNATVGRRKALAYDLTDTGRQALQDWLCNLERALDPGLDPLRMRLLFIDLVEQTRREDFLGRAMRGVSEAANTTPFVQSGAGADNIVHQIWMQARQSAFQKSCKTLFDLDL